MKILLGGKIVFSVPRSIGNRKMMWLVEGLKPDFKTIADFRSDDAKALKNVFKEFVLFCHKMRLIV